VPKPDTWSHWTLSLGPKTLVSRKQFKKRKDLFWLIVSEISVHDLFAPLLWAVVRQASWRQEGISE
jgi:hypothetical protein